MSYLLLHWHEVAYLLLAIIFVATYVVHFLPGLKDSKLKKLLEVETILMVVLIFVAGIAAQVDKVAQEMEKQDDLFNEIVGEALREKGLAKIREIESASDMYSAMIAARALSAHGTENYGGTVEGRQRVPRTRGISTTTGAW